MAEIEVRLMMRVEIRLSSSDQTNDSIGVAAAVSNNLLEVLSRRGYVVHSFVVEEEDAQEGK